MAILPTVFLLFLFLIGLFSTLFTIPTKKLPTLRRFQSSSQDSVNNQVSEEQRNNDENKMTMNTRSSFYSDSSERKAELKNVFATFDKNKDGFITKQELRDSLNKIGISTSKKGVLEMVQRVDVNGDGLIDFGEFCELFESMMGGEDEDGSKIDGGDSNLDLEDSDLKDAFDVFDGDKNGLISVEELGLVLDSLGFKEGRKLEDCKQMISKADGDGMINFHEFKNMMKNGVNLVLLS